MGLTALQLLSFRCVTHFYVQFVCRQCAFNITFIKQDHKEGFIKTEASRAFPQKTPCYSGSFFTFPAFIN